MTTLPQRRQCPDNRLFPYLILQLNSFVSIILDFSTLSSFPLPTPFLSLSSFLPYFCLNIDISAPLLELSALVTEFKPDFPINLLLLDSTTKSMNLWFLPKNGSVNCRVTSTPIQGGQSPQTKLQLVLLGVLHVGRLQNGACSSTSCQHSCL